MASFTDFFEFSPQVKIKLVSSKFDDIFTPLIEKISEHNGTLDIGIYGDTLPDLNHIAIKKLYNIPSLNKPYKAISRDYESIILHNVLSLHTMPQKILELTYRSLENSAIIIVLEDKSKNNAEEIKTLLDECEFRASNIIEDLLEDYNIIVAKKMHMWGNGL